MRHGNPRGVFSWRAAGTGREEAAPGGGCGKERERKAPLCFAAGDGRAENRGGGIKRAKGWRISVFSCKEVGTYGRMWIKVVEMR